MQKNPFNDNPISSLIISTILAFIVAKVLDPILTYLYSSFLNVSGKVFTYISDSTYQQISFGLAEQTSAMSLYLLYTFSFVTLNMFCFKISTMFKKEFDDLKNCERELTLLCDINDGSPPYFNDEVIQAPLVEEKTLKKKTQSIQSNISITRKKLFRQIVFFGVILLFLMLSLNFIYAKTCFIRNKVTIATNNIEIISPYISDLEYKKLKSSFYSIQNREDYDNLISQLNIIAEKHSIELKK